jgi:plastocyanin
MSRFPRSVLLMTALLGIPTCGRRDELLARGMGGDGGGAQIVIQNFTFSPAQLEVAPGDTVEVQNLDSMPHSVTSQSAPGTFTPGAVEGVSFDTGPFSGSASFTIPASARHGMTIPYFCTVHRSAMANSGSITIR